MAVLREVGVFYGAPGVWVTVNKGLGGDGDLAHRTITYAFAGVAGVVRTRLFAERLSLPRGLPALDQRFELGPHLATGIVVPFTRISGTLVDIPVVIVGMTDGRYVVALDASSPDRWLVVVGAASADWGVWRIDCAQLMGGPSLEDVASASGAAFW